MRFHCAMPGCLRATPSRRLPFCSSCWGQYKDYGTLRAAWPEWLRYLANTRERELYMEQRDSTKLVSLDGMLAAGRPLPASVENTSGQKAKGRSMSVRIDWQNMVSDFHVKFGCSIGQPGGPWQLKDITLGASLCKEEMNEFETALGIFIQSDLDPAYLPDAMKELADVVYVLNGLALRLGVSLAEVFAEVHRSNMSKVGGGRSVNGKVLKPARGWRGANVAAVLDKQRAEYLERVS